MAQKSVMEELEEESAKYANGLSELGLQPGDRVTIQVNKCPEVVYIYLACLRANLIFHPLNTAYKENELSFLLMMQDLLYSYAHQIRIKTSPI